MSRISSWSGVSELLGMFSPFRVFIVPTSFAFWLRYFWLLEVVLGTFWILWASVLLQWLCFRCRRFCWKCWGGGLRVFWIFFVFVWIWVLFWVPKGCVLCVRSHRALIWRVLCSEMKSAGFYLLCHESCSFSKIFSLQEESSISRELWFERKFVSLLLCGLLRQSDHILSPAGLYRHQEVFRDDCALHVSE